MRDLAGCGLTVPEALLKGDSLMRRTFPCSAAGCLVRVPGLRQVHLALSGRLRVLLTRWCMCCALHTIPLQGLCPVQQAPAV